MLNWRCPTHFTRPPRPSLLPEYSFRDSETGESLDSNRAIQTAGSISLWVMQVLCQWSVAFLPHLGKLSRPIFTNKIKPAYFRTRFRLNLPKAMDTQRSQTHDCSPTPSSQNTEAGSKWSPADAARLYGVDTWANQFFGISDCGEVEVYLEDEGRRVALSLPNIVEGIRERGLEVPLLLRFPDLLAAQIRELNGAFEEAISLNNYRGKYRGVYPIKVNQQQQVIEEITRFGRRYHFGLEAGSKPELLAALAYLHDPEAYLVCNGYKDREFIDLALCAVKMGLQTVLVVEMPGMSKNDS